VSTAVAAWLAAASREGASCWPGSCEIVAQAKAANTRVAKTRKGIPQGGYRRIMSLLLVDKQFKPKLRNLLAAAE
jgi:hypothetical protein